MSVNLAAALASLRPGAQWATGTSYDSIQWFDEVQTKPTEDEVNAELLRLQEIYDRNEYQRLRERAYPSWEEQMDILYHQGYDGWKAAIQAIKDQYPKPV